jgi:hypothetical protein
MHTLKVEQEDLRSNRQILWEAANEFSGVCSAVFEKAIDSKGVFDTVVDFVQNMNEIPDTKAMDKLEYAVDLMDETPRAAGATAGQTPIRRAPPRPRPVGGEESQAAGRH